MKILVSDKLSEKGVEIFRQSEGIDVVVKTGMSKEELIREIPEYDALVVRSATKVTKDVIESAARLKVIGRAGIGVDNIDLEAAGKKGIVVMNTPEGNTVTTAEHAISLMLSLARSIPQAHSSIRAGKWEKKFMGVELYNKTLGVIGLGRIGSIVANRGKGLAMKVIAFDPFISKDRAKTLGVELVELEELFKRSDFITIHVPKTEETSYLIGEKEFAIMKPEVRIVNCARGGIINEAALITAIKEKRVAGAALDVYEIEPLPADSPLRAITEIVLTPHLGASTDEAQENVAIGIAEQIVDMLKNGQVRNALNSPSLSSEALEKIQPYMNLAEKIGAILAQLIEGGIQEINITYSGDLIDHEIKPVTVSLLKGFLQVFAGEGVINMVNAPVFAKERGINVTETTSSGAHDYTSLLNVRVKTEKMEKQIYGTVFGKNDPRIIRIDDFWVEASPTEYMLLLSNKDLPGVIGQIGTFLGKKGVNIAGMQLGRNHPLGNAVAIVNIDSDLPEKTIEELRAMPNINYVKMIRL